MTVIREGLELLVAEDIRGYIAYYYRPETNDYFASSEDDEPGAVLTAEEYEDETMYKPYLAGRDIREVLRKAGYTTDPRSGNSLC